MSDPLSDLLATYSNQGYPSDYYGMGYPDISGMSATEAAEAISNYQNAPSSGGGGGGGSAPPPPPDYAYDPDQYSMYDGGAGEEKVYSRMKNPDGSYMTNNQIADAYAQQAYKTATTRTSYAPGGYPDPTGFYDPTPTRRGSDIRSPTTTSGGGGSGGGGSGGGAPAPSGPTNTSVTRVSDQQTRETRYIDIPTDEEFLNDFRNAYNTYLGNVAQAGGINSMELQWLRNNEDIVFGEFIAEQGRRAARGEDIFGVLNAGDFEVPDVPPDTPVVPDPKGGLIPVNPDGSLNWGKITDGLNLPEWLKSNLQDSPLSKIWGSAEQQPMIAEGSGADPNSDMVTVGSPAGMIVEGSGADPNSDMVNIAIPGAESPYGKIGERAGDKSTTVTNTTTTDDQGNISNVKDIIGRQSTEDLVTRPNIGIGYKYTPTEFLSDTTDAARLRRLFEGRRGQRYVEGRTEGRTAARRVY